MKLLLALGLLGSVGYLAYRFQQHMAVNALPTATHKKLLLEDHKAWTGTRWEKVS